MTISICLGSVRIGTAQNWDQAREILRRDINDFYPRFGNSTAEEWRLAEIARADGPIDSDGWLWTSRPGIGLDSCRYARVGEHGLTAGMLATVHDYRHNNRDIWTIDVKCRITAINGPCHRATVAITGDSQQFTRGESVTMPSSFIRPRSMTR